MGKKKMPNADPNKPPGLDDEIDEETLKVGRSVKVIRKT